MATPYLLNAGGPGPVVVQGHVVSANQAPVTHSKANRNPNSEHLLHGHYSTQQYNQTWTKAELQPRKCRDFFWGLLFYLQLVALAVATVKYVPGAVQQMAEGLDEYEGGDGDRARRFLVNTSPSSPGTLRWLEENNDAVDEGAEYRDGDYTYDNVDMSIDMQAIIGVLGLCGLAGFIISTLAMTLMMSCPQVLIKISLCFNIIVTMIITLVALISGILPLAALCGVGFLFSAYYAYVVWNRIPFAAANLCAAVTAVKSNMGLTFFAYTNLILTFLWSLWWSVAVVATTYVLNECDNNGNCEAQRVNGFMLFLFLVSYFWTAQVLKNVVHTTVAGTVGSWWYSPAEASCCGNGVRDSYLRSVTTSFGSIALGSLIVAVIQAVREVVQSIRDDDGGGSMLLCCAQLLLSCIEQLAEYFNQWAFVYVGVYGYSFMEASRNVVALFRYRGWTAIIADILVDTVLLMMSLIVGVLTGIVGASLAGIVHGSQGTILVGFM